MRSARLALALFLAVGLGCAQKDWIDRTLVTENVTGVWAGSLRGGTGRYQFELQQQGAKVTGTLNMSTTVSGGYSGPVEGSMIGDVFTFKDVRGAYSGELTVAGDEMAGYVDTPFGRRNLSLRRASR